MAEISRFWDGLVTGDAVESPYDAATDFARVIASIADSFGKTNRGGVCNEDNDLEVSGVATPVQVDTGSAIVYGTWYNNSAAVSVAIPTPAAATRIDRIVIRKSWAAQTARITRIAGAEGGAAPAMTQAVGVTWDIPLASVSITTGGVITVTDNRELLGSTLDHTHTGGADLSQIPTAGIADDAVTSDKIDDDSIVNANINSAAAIDQTKLSFGAGFRAHRHPYANDRHIEASFTRPAGWANNTTTTFNVTFDDIFAARPNVVFGVSLPSAGGPGSFKPDATSISATGMTVTIHQNTLEDDKTADINWMVEGQD